MEITEQITDKFTKAQNRLVLQASDLSLETVAAMVEKGSIDVAPVFQRRERWSHEQQSALIESFLLNVPVPPVYLSEDDFGTYSVIDGKQRITTIRDFMRNKLVLSQLAAFPEIRWHRFCELPRQLQNALLVRPYLRVVTLLKQSDPILKYEVFTRLNRGGEPLNPQEIRNVAFRGPMNEMVYILATDIFLKQQLKIKNNRSPAYKEMADAEFVLRFLTLHQGWRNFTGSFRRSMDQFMSENQSANQREIDRFRALFNRSIRACERLWKDRAFKRPEAGTWRHQTLAGMYDAQMLAVAELNDAQVSALARKSRDVVEATRKLFQQDGQFEEAVRRGTNTPSKLVYRVEKLKAVLISMGAKG